MDLFEAVSNINNDISCTTDCRITKPLITITSNGKVFKAEFCGIELWHSQKRTKFLGITRQDEKLYEDVESHIRKRLQEILNEMSKIKIGV